MFGFRRRRGARSGGLGAAVTGIPSAPVVPAAVPVPLAVSVPVIPVAVIPVQAAPEPALPTPVPPAPVAAPSVPALSVPAPPALTPRGPRVELGFRDGSHASLDPRSQEAQALDELARLLSGRS